MRPSLPHRWQAGYTAIKAGLVQVRGAGTHSHSESGTGTGARWNPVTSDNDDRFGDYTPSTAATYRSLEIIRARVTPLALRIRSEKAEKDRIRRDLIKQLAKLERIWILSTSKILYIYIYIRITSPRNYYYLFNRYDFFFLVHEKFIYRSLSIHRAKIVNKVTFRKVKR